MDDQSKHSILDSSSSHGHIIRIENILWEGLTLWKIPFHTVGNPQRRVLCINKQSNPTVIKRGKQNVAKVQILKSNTSAQMESASYPISLELTDCTSNSTTKQITVKDIMDIKQGQTTHAFKAFKTRHGLAALPFANFCFSIICSERTYDFYTDSPNLTTMILEALRKLLNQFLSSSSSRSLQALTIANLRSKFDPKVNERHFFAAAKSGDTTTFLWYLDHGLSVDVMEDNDRKDTPLIAACRLGRTEIVQIALQFNAKNDPHPEFGRTALQVAVASGHVECARLILETAAESDVNHIISNHEDSNKEAPIHVASRCGNVNMLELLIDHGANVSLVDGRGKTCLHSAAQSGNYECLNFLLFTGCGDMLENRDDQGYSPLHVSVKANKFECVQTLLEHGADIDLLTIDGKSPLVLAGRSEKMHQILLQFSSKVPPVDVVSFEREEFSEDDLFAGLSVFNISGGVRTPHRKSDWNVYHSSENVELSRWGAMQQVMNNTYQYSSPSSSERCNNDHNFYSNGEFWYICYNSGYPYFVRDVDQHSQVSFFQLQYFSSTTFNIVLNSLLDVKWYDPRVYGTIFHEDEVVLNDNSSCPAIHNYNTLKIHESESAYTEHVPTKQPEFQMDALKMNKLEFDSRDFDDQEENEWGKCNHNPIERNSEGSKGRVNSLESSKDFDLAKSKNISIDTNSVKPGVNVIRPDGSKNPHISVDTSKYEKMVEVGIPIESVIHKMKLDGLDHKIIDVFAVDKSTQKANLDKSGTLNERQKRKDNKVTEASDRDVEEKLLNDPRKNDTLPPPEILNQSKYRKMVAVGIPLESVAHKMKADGVEEEIVTRFVKDKSKSNCDDYEELKPVMNQVKTGQEEDVVGIDTCKSRFENDAALAKYRKMASVGVPHQSIANKMRQEGIDSKKIDDFEVAFGVRVCDPKNHDRVGGADTRDSVNTCKSRFENDATVLKYRKMASVGVPHQSIANKMRLEGVDSKKIEDFEIAFGLRKPSQKMTTLTKGSFPLPIPPSTTRRTSVKMQKIHWKAISEEKVSKSLWADDTNYESDIDDKEVQQLESLFGETKVNSKSATKARSQAQSSRAMNLSLIDVKRANNIAISLAQYKMFQNYDELCGAVATMDATKLTSEHLLNMKALLPTVDEVKKVATHSGGTEGLGRAELFFLSVSKIPRFAQKHETFAFTVQFNLHVKELKESLLKLKDTCDGVVNNKKLAAILRKLLAIGNLVNEGAGKSRARGITVDSLLKTAKRTGSDGKTTVIYIVVANFLKQDETGSSVDFWSEIETLRDASRIDMKDCRSSFKEIEMGVKKINFSIEKEKAECENSKFLQRSSEFVLEASKTMKFLQDKMSQAEASVGNLCSFFAEDPKICQVCTQSKNLICDYSVLLQSLPQLCIRQRQFSPCCWIFQSLFVHAKKPIKEMQEH